MNPKRKSYKIGGSVEIHPLPKMRKIVVEMLNEGKRMHHVHGIMQYEIMKPRKVMQAYKERTGESLSMTAYIIHCLAHAIDEDKILHAYRKGKKVYLFDDVDVSTIIERVDETGKFVPTTMIIRRANKKSLMDIHNEIRKAQVVELKGTALGEGKEAKRTNLFLKLPKLVRKFVWWKTRRDPKFKKDNIGTVCVTAVGMFTEGGTGWAVPLGPWALMLTIGTISKRQYHIDDQVLELEFINLTLSVDHDVVDGAPATRFVVRLKDMVESGYGLEEFESPQ